jgi:hypothetical protein
MGHQYLVGGVACVMGAVSLTAAIQNHEGFFRLAKFRQLEVWLGRNNARWFCGLCGCGLIALGLCIAGGWLPRKMPVRAEHGVDLGVRVAC